MKFRAMQSTLMAGKLGDIFWDLPPYIVYSPGFDIGCNIYVANPTDKAKEYALMAYLTSDSTLISEEALPVYGYTWFTVEPGDFVTLKGALRFSQSGAVLTVSLVEKESGQATDFVSTSLIAPSTSVLPPTWSSMLTSMMPFLMFAMLGIMMVQGFKPGKEK